MSKKISKTIISTIIFMTLLIAIIAEIPIAVQGQTTTNNRDGAAIPLPSGVTPDVTYETIAHMSFRPNPIGLGQPLLVNIWMQPPTHVSRYFTGLTVTLTKPDGTTDTIGPISTYYGDATAWFNYNPDQIGNWTIKFNFPGAFYPAGNYTVPADSYYAGQGMAPLNAPLSIYYKPSSDGPYTFVVQQDVVRSWPGSPLPTDYWTRPVSPENREWWSILGNYPSTGIVAGIGRGVSLADWPTDTNTYMSNYQYIPYVQGPKSSHIVWKQQGTDAGLIGGTIGISSFQNGPGGPSIIYNGRCYQTVTKVAKTLVNGTYYDMPTSVWQCYDLQTGKIYWEQTGLGSQTPTSIMYSEREMDVVPGETASTLGMRVDLLYVGGNRLITYNAWTGAVKVNMSIAPLSTGTYYASYDWPYFLTVQDLGATAANAPGGRYRLINWTMAGDVVGFSLGNFRLGICNNITWPFSSLGVVDYESNVAVVTGSVTTSSTGVTYSQLIMGASITTGQLLWNVSTDASKGTGGFFSGSTSVADHGKFAVRENDGHWHCWDLKTGKELWVNELSSWPWGTFGCYGTASYGGNIISNQYDGVVAYNWTNGKVSWRYKYLASEYPYESFYSESATGENSYPWFTGTVRICDGVIYAYNDEHSISEPIPRGYRLHCINASNGEAVWTITGRMTPSAVADGYLVGSNAYDGYMYVFGKGLSTTTVTAPDIIVSQGTGVMIKGTVLDNSPAQPGTPCVSKDSMTTQMEYLHMQHPIDGIDHQATITGVPVSIDAIDPNGNYIHIGDTTTNGYGGDFGFAWTPQTEGKYSITASFGGDDSYGSSMATTTMSVGPAPQATTNSQTQTSVPDYTMTIAAGFVAIAIVVIISVAIAVMILKRK
jgi:hypothetical protein